MTSTNHLIQPSYASKQRQQPFEHLDQSKSTKKKSKKELVDSQNKAKNANRSFALYNQKNGRIGKFINSFRQQKSLRNGFVEGVVKNRINVVTDDTEESRIVDEETESEDSCV